MDEDDLPRWRTKLGRRVDPERVSVLDRAGIEVDWKAVAQDWSVPVRTDPSTGEVLRRARSAPVEMPGEEPDEAS